MNVDLNNLPENEDEIKKIMGILLDENAFLKEQVSLLTYNKFGQKSEKISLAEYQMMLFGDNDSVQELDKESDEEEEETVVVKKKKKKSPGRKSFPKELPRKEIIHDIPEEKKICCGQEKQVIGTHVSERLRFIPATFIVEVHKYLKYSCSICQGTESDDPAVIQAPPAPQLIPKSIATSSLLANIFASKFVDSVPFYRQEQRFSRLNISISRKNMSNWAIKTAAASIILYKIIGETIKEDKFIGIDETRFQVLDEPDKKATSLSYMWVYRANTREYPVIYYQYADTRSSKIPRDFLEDYRGTVQTDGYAGYDFLDKSLEITHIVCWAHSRRKFMEVLNAHDKKKNKKSKSGKQTKIALKFIKNLYKIEKECRENNLTPDEILKKRQNESVTVLNQFKLWLDNMAVRTPPKILLGKAISYTLKQWPRLIKYAEDGNLLIDNNMLENSIRPYVVGRKNWLFNKSVEGAHATAIFYTLVETAKAHNLNPEHYFNYIFEKLPLADTVEKHEALLPWNLTPEQIIPNYFINT